MTGVGYLDSRLLCERASNCSSAPRVTFNEFPIGVSDVNKAQDDSDLGGSLDFPPNLKRRRRVPLGRPSVPGNLGLRGDGLPRSLGTGFVPLSQFKKSRRRSNVMWSLTRWRLATVAYLWDGRDSTPTPPDDFLRDLFGNFYAASGRPMFTTFSTLLRFFLFPRPRASDASGTPYGRIYASAAFSGEVIYVPRPSAARFLPYAGDSMQQQRNAGEQQPPQGTPPGGSSPAGTGRAAAPETDGRAKMSPGSRRKPHFPCEKRCGKSFNTSHAAVDHTRGCDKGLMPRRPGAVVRTVAPPIQRQPAPRSTSTGDAGGGDRLVPDAVPAVPGVPV